MIKRISRDGLKYDPVRLLDNFARTSGGILHDQSVQADFLAIFSESLKANLNSPILLHGFRTETMFAYVAAALGKCSVVKQEDAGNVYAMEPNLRVPDFRIVVERGREILIEVKNYRPRNPLSEFRLSCDYLEGLQKYASTFKQDLYLAIFWSEAKIWSLVPADCFDRISDHCVLSISNAMKYNEMAMLGTVPPLELALYSDLSKPRNVPTDGKVEFTIGRVELLSGGEPISDPMERKIAWFLLLYGRWPGESKPTPEVVDGELIAVRFCFAPEERANPDEDFEIVGSLSEMVSRQYSEMTAPSGSVDLLLPRNEPSELGVLIPPDFRGQKLRLWRFLITPAN